MFWRGAPLDRLGPGPELLLEPVQDLEADNEFCVPFNLLQLGNSITVHGFDRIVERYLPLYELLFLSVVRIDFKHSVRVQRAGQRGHR